MSNWFEQARGQDCPFDDPRVGISEFLYPVQKLGISTLYLDINQTYRGHCVLIFDARHVIRIDQLTAPEWRSLAVDLQTAVSAVVSACKPDHVNVASIGQLVPHLHWHIVPRYKEDPRWGGPIWTTAPEEMHERRLSDAGYSALAAMIKSCLASPIDWPNDVDGDTFRRLQTEGFDFSIPREIRFHVDFEHWPPPEAAVSLLGGRFPELEVTDPEPGDSPGFVTITQRHPLDYEFVTNMQAELSGYMSQFGGVCQSWSVVH